LAKEQVVLALVEETLAIKVPAEASIEAGPFPRPSTEVVSVAVAPAKVPIKQARPLHLLPAVVLAQAQPQEAHLLLKAPRVQLRLKAQLEQAHPQEANLVVARAEASIEVALVIEFPVAEA
jgi:hypothetical protein